MIDEQMICTKNQGDGDLDEILKQILSELQALKEGQDTIRSELKAFRDSQEAANKLLRDDSAGIKNQLSAMFAMHSITNMHNRQKAVAP